MLDIIYRKTEKILIFETGETGEKYKLPDMGDSVEKWMHNLFKGKGCKKVETISNESSSRTVVAVYK